MHSEPEAEVEGGCTHIHRHLFESFLVDEYCITDLVCSFFCTHKLFSYKYTGFRGACQIERIYNVIDFFDGRVGGVVCGLGLSWIPFLRRLYATSRGQKPIVKGRRKRIFPFRKIVFRRRSEPLYNWFLTRNFAYNEEGAFSAFWILVVSAGAARAFSFFGVRGSRGCPGVWDIP